MSRKCLNCRRTEFLHIFGIDGLWQKKDDLKTFVHQTLRKEGDVRL